MRYHLLALLLVSQFSVARFSTGVAEVVVGQPTTIGWDLEAPVISHVYRQLPGSTGKQPGDFVFEPVPTPDPNKGVEVRANVYVDGVLVGKEVATTTYTLPAFKVVGASPVVMVRLVQKVLDPTKYMCLFPVQYDFTNDRYNYPLPWVECSEGDSAVLSLRVVSATSPPAPSGSKPPPGVIRIIR